MRRLMIAVVVLGAPAVAAGQETEAELAHKLNNPVANMTSVPLQWNYDCCIGQDKGGRYTLNAQPVIPFSLGGKRSLIVRTILPIIAQGRTSPAAGSVSGFGDITQSFFLTGPPKNGLTVAFGPAFLWPIGSNGLSADKWGAGPTALVLKEQGRSTFGLLTNHIWSFADAGDSKDRQQVNSTFVQPFFSWTSATATTIGLNAETSYDWNTREWAIPVNFTVSHLYRFGKQRVSLGGGLRVYAATNGGGPDWGLRFTSTFLFPK